MTPSASHPDSARTVQDRPPNFRSEGRLFLVRCFVCEPTHGRENYALTVASGRCAWCGWPDHEDSA
jgi:hypothetical protein